MYIHNVVCILLFASAYYFLARWYGSEEDKRKFNSYENAVYYTTITHFTIGFGDISPKSQVIRRLTMLQVFTSFYVLRKTLVWHLK